MIFALETSESNIATGSGISARQAMNWLLIAGIALRLIVLLTASPFNPDPHFEIVQYWAEHGTPPRSDVFGQSFQPPLYYILMAALYRVWPGDVSIHIASFLISCINLILIRRILENPSVIPQSVGRIIAFALVCVLPEYVMYGSFISNDTLTILIGTMIFWGMIRYLQDPSGKRLTIMGMLIGVGLLTKGTFLLSGPALAVLVFIVESRRANWRRAVGKAAAFCAIWAVLGCYKFVENYVTLGRPLVHNIETPAVNYSGQKGTWKGFETIYDINILKLIRTPVLNVLDVPSYPILLYGTFWYPYMPESSFFGNRFGYQWVGSLIYATGIVPTIFFLIGLGRGIVMHRDLRGLVVMGSLLLLLSNLTVVIAAGVRFDAWSCFQSRLYFQSMLPLMVLFGLGMESLPRSQSLRRIVCAFCWAAVACCVLYFAVEVALTENWLQPGPELLPWGTIRN